jgi:hypothetical protein
MVLNEILPDLSRRNGVFADQQIYCLLRMEFTKMILYSIYTGIDPDHNDDCGMEMECPDVS